jgi:mannose-6-phosphate isomerase-like protein (cupin superfamily)
MVVHARSRRIDRLYLLTTTATGFFSKLGFAQTDRASVPEALRATTQFASVCPSSSICMTKGIASDALFYGTEGLPLKLDPSGSRFWSVHLANSQLTYFEVPPQARFESHRHPSEQITLVLEGELYFEIDSGTVRVAAGETIALPSNTPHAVFTKETPARAIDAWSPPNTPYCE